MQSVSSMGPEGVLVVSGGNTSGRRQLYSQRQPVADDKDHNL